VADDRRLQDAGARRLRPDHGGQRAPLRAQLPPAGRWRGIAGGGPRTAGRGGGQDGREGCRHRWWWCVGEHDASGDTAAPHADRHDSDAADGAAADRTVRQSGAQARDARSVDSRNAAIPDIAVKEVIAAANAIATLPYIYGGGHATWNDTGYDCSGSTSFALHGAGLISAPEDSGELESYGQPGAGSWITLYANGGHVYMNIAGLWFDTAAQSSSNGNDRWSTTRISSASGFVVRHPLGF